MISRILLRVSLAAWVVAGVLGQVVRADTGWTVIPSISPVSFTGAMGTVVWNYTDGSLGGTSGVSDPNGNPSWIQEYTAVAQNQNDNNPIDTFRDPNFGTYAGFANSLATSGSGTFTTVGASNTFLSSINFGSRPPSQTDFSQFHPTTNFTQSGNYYPQGDTGGGGGGSGDYGNATPAQVAGTLVGVPGQNWNNSGPLSATPGGGPLDPGFGPNHTGTAGRVALTQTAGYANSNGNATTVNSDGTFNSGIVHFTGVLAFSVNFQGDNGNTESQAFTQQSFYSLLTQLSGNGIADIGNNLSGLAATGFVGRGDGVHVPQYQYVLNVPYQGDLPFGTGNGDEGKTGLGSNIGTAVFFDLRFTTTFVAQMNHPWGQGDTNFDNIVNGQDIANVASHWLSTNINHVGPGDATGDGIVNGQDIAMIASHWLQTSSGGGVGGGGGGSGTAVPEPGTWLLLGFGLVGVLAIRRRVR